MWILAQTSLTDTFSFPYLHTKTETIEEKNREKLLVSILSVWFIFTIHSSWVVGSVVSTKPKLCQAKTTFLMKSFDAEKRVVLTPSVVSRFRLILWITPVIFHFDQNSFEYKRKIISRMETRESYD